MNVTSRTNNVSECLDDDVALVPPAGETLRGRCAHAHRPCKDKGCGTVTPGAPVPPSVPKEFVVRLGNGWGGGLHDLADGLAEWELGAEAAVEMMLTWMTFVEIELKGFDDLLEQLRLLRGALVTAGIEAVGTIRDNSTDW